MADNMNSVPDVAGNNPVIVVPSPRVHTTMGSTLTQPITVSVPVKHNDKPEKFTGLNFKTRQQKMLFYLTTLNLARFLKEDPSTVREDEVDIQTFNAVEAWKHSDFLCRNYVLNGLSNKLYNVYSSKKTAKELWESLNHKYKSKDAGARSSWWANS